MKVLKDNYTKASTESPVKVEIKPYPRLLICEDCRSELEYEKLDLRMCALGCMYLDCPCCGRDNMIEENEGTITLTADNVEFLRISSAHLKKLLIAVITMKLEIVFVKPLIILEKIKRNMRGKLNMEISILLYFDMMAMKIMK